MADDGLSSSLLRQGLVSANRFRITWFLFLLLGVAAGQTYSRDALCTSPLMKGSRIFLNEVPEDLPVGATVGNLQLKGSSSQITLSYVVPHNPYLDFDTQSQNVTVRQHLDREKFDSIDIKVSCKMIHTGFEVFIPITLPILDVNDNPPVFIDAPYSASVGELLPVNATVLSGIKAFDPDSDNWKITFAILQDTPYADHFAFSSDTDGNIVLRKPLDYEQTQSITLHIVAKDNHPAVLGLPSPQLNTTTTAVISIFDGDDQNPRFTKSSYLAYVTENAPIGTAIQVIPPLYAYDLDFVINASVTYSFIPDTIYIPPQSDYFAIDPYTGFVVLSNDVLRRGEQFTLLVKATQVDNPNRYTTALLYIKVQAANENQPRFIQQQYSVSLVENVPIGSYVTTVSAIDNDVMMPMSSHGPTNLFNDEGTVLIYGFTRPDLVKDFKIDSRTGVITTARQLSYEQTPRYNISVSVTDGQWFGYSLVVINLINVNNHNPTFERSVYYFQGHKEPDFFIGKVHAVDMDIGSTLTYSFVQNSSLFSITPQGEIYLVGDLDAIDDDDVITLLVSAEDNWSPPRKDAAVVMVTFGVGAAATMATETDLVIIIILAVLSGCLLLIIIVLSIYIYRNQNSPSTAQPYSTEAEHIDAYFETSKSFERGINDIPTDYHNSYIDSSVGVYKPTARDRHLAMYNDVATGNDSTAVQENPFQNTGTGQTSGKGSTQSRTKSTHHGPKDGKSSYSGYSAQSILPANSRSESRSSHPGSQSSRSQPQSSQSVARSEAHSSDYSDGRQGRHRTDYAPALSPMDDEVYSTLSTSDPSFRNSAASLNMFKVGNSTQALVPPHSPAGSGVFKGKGSSVSFIDDHQVNVYHPDNVVSRRDKPEITVYY